MRDKLDTSTLLLSLTRIVFDDIRSDKTMSDEKKIEKELLDQQIMWDDELKKMIR